jgi:cytoskeletal protein CcmA (bactofilin family)
MKLVGDVTGEEDFVVFGTVEGEIAIDGAVVVESSGTVRGNVQGRTVTVRGVIIGDASAAEAIRVDDGGRMVGDVHAPRVNIVKGARFRGHVHMTGSRTDVPRVEAIARPRRARSVDPIERPIIRHRPSQPPLSEKPTMPGSLRAVQNAETLVGTDLGDGPGRPPPPRMPSLRRTRARRKDT